jgi:hypothetical protein
MRTIVIVGAVVLAGATIIGLMVSERKNEGQPSFSDQGISQTATDGSSINTSGSPTLNPAHGQPGHRCELPVGAPLTGNAGTQTPTTIPAAATQQAAPAGITLNPAHGQPGHRCDLAVGAPLNSTPNTTARTQTPVATTKAVPATQAAPAGLKINPAHGQPGHRCDLAVGAPLTSTSIAKPASDSIK